MDKKEIKEIYKKKIKLIERFNISYYNESNPVVSDRDYDQLKKEILLLEDKYKFLTSEKSPSKIIGHKPSKNFKKAKHRVPMLSLSNAFSEDDL